MTKLNLIAQAQNDWNAFVSGKFVSYLGKSSESELSATKQFYQAPRPTGYVTVKR